MTRPRPNIIIILASTKTHQRMHAAAAITTSFEVSKVQFFMNFPFYHYNCRCVLFFYIHFPSNESFNQYSFFFKNQWMSSEHVSRIEFENMLFEIELWKFVKANLTQMKLKWDHITTLIYYVHVFHSFKIEQNI